MIYLSGAIFLVLAKAYPGWHGKEAMHLHYRMVHGKLQVSSKETTHMKINKKYDNNTQLITMLTVLVKTV